MFSPFSSKLSLGQRFLRLLLNSLFFSLFLSLLFVLMRLGFFLYTGIYKDALVGKIPWDQVGQVFLDGFKYDNRVVAAFSLIFLLLQLLRSKSTPNLYALFAISLSLFLQVANITFYSIYGDAFDTNLLDAFNQTFQILWSMAISGEYSIGSKILIWLLCSALCYYLYLKTMRGAHICFQILQDLPLKPSLAVVFLSFSLWTLYGINSRLALTGISLDLHIQPVDNLFLRKITPGAFRNLCLVFRDYRKSRSIRFSDFTSKTLLQASIDYFHLPKDTKLPLDLRQLLKHTSQNPLKPSITHVFYIVSESLSSWHFDPQFDAIGLVSNLKSLRDDKHGFILPLFLENGRRTVKSLDVQITGLFNINDTNFVRMGVKIPPLPTAIGNQMKALGFHNVFYYGGSGIWNRLDSFTKTQGFDKLIFNTPLLEYAKDDPNKGKPYDPKAYPEPIESNWGVHDNILFDYILEKTPVNQKTFSMMMTLSNHPTRNVNLKAFMVPVFQIEDFVKKFPKQVNMPNANFLGHIYWYDQILVNFIKKASVKFPNSLFVITGDHFDRSFEYAKDNIYWTKSVPLILYAPSLTPKEIACIGSHIDIAPTIMELVAPKGHPYVSFGKPLFSNNPTSSLDCNSDSNFALGFEAIASPSQTPGLNFIYQEGRPLFYLAGQKRLKKSPLPADLRRAKNLMEKDKIANGLSWYFLFKGPLLQDIKGN
ncbi:LTA synthase family protein [Helicobacter suis]|nr:sulfatase [Helicobacter suis HS1]